MEMMTNISKLTRQAGLAFAAVLWLGLNTAGISSARAADVSNTCAVQFHPCKIDGAAASRNLYPNSRIEEMQKGCLNTVPVETKGSLNSVGRISEEACHRSTGCNSSYSTKVKYPDGICYREHQGMDVAVPEGTPVTAAADGVILSISSCYGGGGNTVIMQHEKAGGGQYTTTYMHLQKFADKTKKIAGTKEKIAKGTTIGYVGTTGCSDGTTKHGAYGAHLHIELRDGGTGKGKILSPACASADALCDGNIPVPEAPVIENDPDPQMVTAEASLGKCGKLLPADNLSAFHQQGESGGDAGAFNKCWADDKGGCSYGVSQMVCYRDSSKWNNSTMASYLQHLQKNDPSKYKALEIGGSLQSTINAACNPPATQFSQKWQALASQDSSFGTSQREYIENHYLSYGKSVLKNAGMGSLLNRSPEMDMIILAGAVAGAGPMRNNFQAVQRAIAPETFETASDETIISAYYASYAKVMYSGYADKTPYAKRAAKDEKLALESLAIRKEMENGSSLEEASQKVTGKRACEEDEYPSASVRLGQASRPAYLNEYTGAVSTESADKGDRECNVESYRSSFKTCIFCDIFGVLFNTASSVAKKSYNALADGVIMLVCVGFALWLGITVMQFISSMEQKNPSILVKTILNKAFLVLIVVTLLRLNSADFFRLAMEPIFNTGFKLAQIATEGANGETCDGSTFDILTEEKGAGLPASMGVSILCTIKTIQDKILDVMALGSTSICVALYVESWHGLALFPHLGYLIVGLVLWIAAILLLIIYPFLLIDSVLQLTVATALLPAAIGAYAFKSTQKYVGKVWDTFLNCMFNFIFLSLIIFILTNGLMDVLSKAGVESGGAMSDVGTRSGYKVILSNLAWWGTTFLKLVFYMILGWAVLGEANSFAGSFAKSIGVKDIGSKVGGLAASTANTAAIGGLKTAGKATRKVGGMALDRGREAYNSYKVNRRAKKIENDDRTVTDADGNKTLQHRTWYGRKVTDTLQVAPDGTRTVTRAKQSLRGNKATSVNNDKFIQNKKTYDKDGNLIREETRMNTAAGKTLLNRDGTRNEVAIHAIRSGSGSGMSNDDVDKAIMNQMMQERMGGVPGADMNREFKDREVSRTLDDQGREVFRVKQTNADGSTSIFEMTKGDKRDMLTYTHIGKNGKAESYASDGIINKKSNYRLNKDGTVDAKSVKNNYAFAKNYNSAHTRSMDSNGKFNRSVPADEIMMSEADMQLFREQVATYGKDQPMAEFGK